MNEQQAKAYNFLLEKFRSSGTFTKPEFQNATGWDDAAFNTYWSKQFKPLVTAVGDRFRVRGVFARYLRPNAFRDQVVSQTRRQAVGYEQHKHEKVIVFEFFMPLRNEEYLRSALDALFFRDSICARLQWFAEGELHRRFPPAANESSETYRNRLCDWIGDRLIGYSISHVGGRFRVGTLKTREEAAGEGRYLVDETTAVVKFILPCAAGTDWPMVPKEHPEEERLPWMFYQLFVDGITELVSDEDEIWLLESGLRSRLHIWRASV